MDSKGIDNWHDTIDGLGGESAISPTNTQEASFQDEHDQQQFLEVEERILLESMLDFHSNDTQSEKEDSEGDGDQSRKQKQKFSESSDNNSAVVEGEEDGDRSEKQKQKYSENFGSSSEMVDLGESSQVQRLVLSPGSKSQGVTYNKNSKHWEAHIWIKEIILRGRKKKGVQIFAGNYRTEDEAKQAHDRLAIKFDIRETQKGKPYSLNFPESAQVDFMSEYRDWNFRDFVWLVRRSSCKFSWGKSSMKGVTVRTPARKRLKTGEEESGPANRYAAKISQGKGQDKKTANIGTYGSEEEAGQAYDRALLFINKEKEVVELWHVITNFRPSDYTEAEILEAGSKLVFKTCKAKESHEIPN